MLNSEVQAKLIKTGRDFTKGYILNDPYEEKFESDQELKLPQPPLVKAPVTPEDSWIHLTRDFSETVVKSNILDLIRDRKSARIYTGEAMTLEQLSFLLWATQGIKSVRGKSYATLRTVPCGGARHEFETYMIVRNVEGLQAGVYHYLPMHHALEFLKPLENIDQTISESLCGQSWAAKANVVFYWSMVAYRAEWRYGIYAHLCILPAPQQDWAAAVSVRFSMNSAQMFLIWMGKMSISSTPPLWALFGIRIKKQNRLSISL